MYDLVSSEVVGLVSSEVTGLVLSSPSCHRKKGKNTLGGDRTLDHKIKSLALYHLSYEGRLGELSTSFYSYTFLKK